MIGALEILKQIIVDKEESLLNVKNVILKQLFGWINIMNQVKIFKKSILLMY